MSKTLEENIEELKAQNRGLKIMLEQNANGWEKCAEARKERDDYKRRWLEVSENLENKRRGEMGKFCNCSDKSSRYSDFGIIKCQYCMGIVKDLKVARDYIDHNTIPGAGRDKDIAKKLAWHRDALEKEQ